MAAAAEKIPEFFRTSRLDHCALRDAGMTYLQWWSGEPMRRSTEMQRDFTDEVLYRDAMQSISTSESPGTPLTTATVVLTGGTLPKRPV